MTHVVALFFRYNTPALATIQTVTRTEDTGQSNQIRLPA